MPHTLHAITRELSPAIVRCELTHLERAPIDFPRASRQHRAYTEALRSLGCRVTLLPAEPGMPDSVFVEDAAIVVDELAIICRPGAESRRAETGAIEPAIAPYRSTIAHIEGPGTVDGGDVLIVGRRVFVGRSTRTNDEGIEQVRDILQPRGYTVEEASVRNCLHLKSACTAIDDHTVLINRAWTDDAVFDGIELIDVDPREPHAANVLPIDGSVLAPASAPRTMDRLRLRGYGIRAIESDELAKAEGGLTCCSLIFREFSTSAAC